MASEHPHDVKSHIRLYVTVFVILTIVTAIEMLPLWDILAIPAPALLAMSLAKFIVVVYFFMHLYGDHAINKRMFFIPLGMAAASVAVLMTLFGTWRLEYQEAARGKDADVVAEHYSGRHEGECNAWVKSPFTGNLYCSSPALAWSTASAYDAFVKKDTGADPAFVDFDKKSADEKQAILMKKGEEVYGASCGACHQASGLGVAGAFPPLAGDPVANGGPVAEHISVVLNGLSGKVINGVTYASAMAPWKQLSNEEIAAVITYERNSWGNSGGIVEPAQVAAAR